MTFTSATQLKDWIKNKAKQSDVPANTLLQSYMMERFLERVSVSPYRENFVLKGGFLIAAMVGSDKRSTMDMDTTIKGMPIDRNEIEHILTDIISLDIGDQVAFEIQNIKPIHDVSDYDDFRVSLRVSLFAVHVNMKIDITIGDTIIPREIEYPYKLMFEDRTIPIMAYNLYTILAEKVETILSRNVANTRGRDFYDVYILLMRSRSRISRIELLNSIRVKASERGSEAAIDNCGKFLTDIEESPDIAKIWASYSKRYSYANGIALLDIITAIRWIFE